MEITNTNHAIGYEITDSTAVRIENLFFKYRDNEGKYALNDINLYIPESQFVVIIGPTGSGKSTLLKALNGLIPHFIKGEYKGHVEVMGHAVKINTVANLSNKVGIVFQDFEAQLFSTSVKLDIVFGPENLCVGKDAIEGILKDTLKVTNLEGLEERHPSTLSGGQKQRLAIASVLAMNPNILCMDEPTTDLDPKGKEEIFDLASNIVKDRDERSVIMVEHEIEQAIKADRVIVLHDGMIIKDDNASNVLKDISLLDAIGIMPLQVTKFFYELQISGEILPLSVREGIKLFNDLGLHINEEKYKILTDFDNERVKEYGETVISCTDLEFSYSPKQKLLKHINLDIRRGEFVAILGHNGSGKTTLAKHFNGLLSPKEGEVYINNRSTKKLSLVELSNEVGYVFQNPDSQIFAETVYDEVAFSLKVKGFSKEETVRRVQEALETVHMNGREQEDPFSLSKGERQRIAVASVLALKPSIVILDEPTTGLDHKEQRSMMELLKNLNDFGHTIIMITHTMWVVSEYAHRVVAMYDGEIILDGKTRDVFGKHEQELKAYSLAVPQIVSMSNAIGKTVLSVEELLYCVERKEVEKK
jgi:energy-coupling factor transporter ATP-binding protein EcfA2